MVSTAPFYAFEFNVTCRVDQTIWYDRPALRHNLNVLEAGKRMAHENNIFHLGLTA
jgi:hypothetical protein